MSNKVMRMVFLGLVLCLLTSANYLYAQPTPFNGVSYVLLSRDFGAYNGVYRLNSYSNGNPMGLVQTPLFKLNTFTGKVSGLSANQENEVFLLSSEGSSGAWQQAPVGWLPTGMAFEDDSPIYLHVVPPSKYNNMIGVHGSGKYWKPNHTIKNVNYKYTVAVRGPDDVKYLYGAGASDQTLGTPIWDGIKGIPHPTKANHVILPSHWGGVAHYLYGSNNNTQFRGQALDGQTGANGAVKPTYVYGDLTPLEEVRQVILTVLLLPIPDHGKTKLLLTQL
jgi:hypothetical protein